MRIALVAILGAACSAAPGLPERPVEVPTETVVAGNVATPSGPVSGTAVGDVQAAAPPASDGGTIVDGAPDGDAAPAPAAAQQAVELADTVEVVQPDYVVSGEQPLDADVVDAVAELPGTRRVAPVGVTTATLSGRGADTEAAVMAVAASEFRPLTPEITAQAVGVWERLVAGDAVVRHDIAAELGLELGGNVLIATDGGSRVLRVGALAANGTPPVAAVLVPWSVGRELGLERPNGFVVAAEAGELDTVADALGALLPEVEVERRRPPQQQTASAGGSTSLEPFNYTDFGDGTIQIDPAWVSEYIQTVELPGIATTRCHKLMIPQLLAALEEVRAVGLYDHFKPEQFGGCWVARHIDWDPTKPLSNHAWGIAVDLNTHDNWLGEEPQMDRRIVAIFEKWGFAWGGHWQRPDGMHFEMERIVRPAGG